MAESKAKYTAGLSDSVNDNLGDAWVVDRSEGSFCEMTCPMDDAEAGANLIVEALNALGLDWKLKVSLRHVLTCSSTPGDCDDCREAAELCRN